MAKSFFATLKKEHVFSQRFHTKEEARRKLFEYLEVFYNRVAIGFTHCPLNGVNSKMTKMAQMKCKIMPTKIKRDLRFLKSNSRLIDLGFWTPHQFAPITLAFRLSLFFEMGLITQPELRE
jgi:hypothetical protein